MIVRNITTECTHCRLPVPAGLIEPNRDEQFCCHGCSMAYQLIHTAGLDAFYRMVDSTGESQTLRDRTGAGAQFDQFDEAGFLSRFARGVPSQNAEAISGDGDPSLVTNHPLLEITLALSGIHCAACVWLVEKLPSLLPGVVSAQVNWSAGTIRVRWLPSQVPLSQIAAALYRLGYTPFALRASEKAVRRHHENRQHLMRIGVAAAAAGNNMIIAAALYLGLFSGMEPGYVWMLRWASCVVGVASLLGPGQVFFRSAWSAIRTRTPHMDLPIALGLGIGTLSGLINTVRGNGEIYFDSLSVLIFLLLVGRWIQFRQQNRAADAIELLYRLTPQRAHKRVDGQVVDVAVEEIETGDILEIRPGDLIPVDSKIMEGRSDVDEAILSGESKPARRKVGDDLCAGTKNVTALLIVCATAVGEDTRISKIVGLVENASTDKPEIVQWANRIGGYFVVTIIVLAALTFGVWMWIAPSLATDRAVALLIVACPCALALATPLAIAVAIGRMAKRRIMIKSGDVIQALDRPGMIWLDKTGTLTEGRLQVVHWLGDRHWIQVAAAIESKFTHPIGTALVEYGNSTDFSQAPIEVTDRILFSNGVSATVNGQTILIGNRKLLEDAGISFASDAALGFHRRNRGMKSVAFRSAKMAFDGGAEADDDRNCISGNSADDRLDFDTIEKQALAQQFSPCWVAVDETIVAMASLGDRIRDDASRALSNLKQRGWKVGILSGDHPAVVNQVARRLEIESVRAGVTPEEKLAVIRASNQQFSTTVMVGDGVNDSAALAAATVGIAVRNGAEASLAAAPVYFGESGLAPIETLLAGSRSTCQTIRRNVTASLVYNVIGASLAMVGWIHPLVAAVLMPLSSLTVIAISLRAGR